jgi:uncharacterized protein (DUF2141 family)
LTTGVAAAPVDPNDPRLAEITPEAIAAIQNACREGPYSMLISVRNIKDPRGVITVDLHGDNPATWLKKGAKIGRFRVHAQKGEVEICIPLAKAGDYAVAVYQDKDLSFNMNKNFLGLPSEPYGVSNDPPMSFGPPNLKDSLVTVQGPLTPAKVTLHN